MSENAETKTTTHDDGKFVRTAVVVGGKDGGGSIDVIHAETQELLARINIFTDEDGSWFCADTIDVDERYAKNQAITFVSHRRVFHDTDRVVAADFRKEE